MDQSTTQQHENHSPNPHLDTAEGSQAASSTHDICSGCKTMTALPGEITRQICSWLKDDREALDGLSVLRRHRECSTEKKHGKFTAQISLEARKVRRQMSVLVLNSCTLPLIRGLLPRWRGFDSWEAFNSISYPEHLALKQQLITEAKTSKPFKRLSCYTTVVLDEKAEMSRAEWMLLECLAESVYQTDSAQIHLPSFPSFDQGVVTEEVKEAAQGSSVEEFRLLPNVTTCIYRERSSDTETWTTEWFMGLGDSSEHKLIQLPRKTE